MSVSSLTPENPYTKMQRDYYDRTAHIMNKENHMFHNGNQDYWDILVSDTEKNYRNKVGLDFGCGCGRNMQNLWYRFERIDGIDISERNLEFAEKNLINSGCPKDRFNLHLSNGTDLNNLKTESYDFVMSTIVLQHICVYEIRFNILKDFLRILKPGGLLSFQMGYGEGYGRAEYYENHYDAQATNSDHDTKVTDPEQITKDLDRVGFEKITHQIRPPYSDSHPNWIFVKAYKPA